MKSYTVLFGSLLFLAGCASEQASVSKKTTSVEVPKTPVAKVESPAERYHREYVERYKAEARETFSGWGVIPAPKAFPPTGVDFDWQESLALGLYYFKEEPRTYGLDYFFESRRFRSFRETDNARALYKETRLQVMVAYGLLQAGNSPVASTEYRQAASTIFLSSRLRSLAYRWAMPSIKKAFVTLPAGDRRDYVAILQHTREYIDSVDLVHEEAYLQSLQGDGCKTASWEKDHYPTPEWVGYGDAGCVRLFTYFGPDGRENPYRKAEAFVFRRLQEGWPRDGMKELLDRAIAELLPLV